MKADGYADKTQLIHVQADRATEVHFKLRYEKRIMGLPPVVFVILTGK